MRAFEVCTLSPTTRKNGASGARLLYANNGRGAQRQHSGSVLCAAGNKVHGVDLKAVEAGEDRGVVFAESLSCFFVVNLENPHAECRFGNEDRTIGKQSSGGKMLGPIDAVGLHQSSFSGRDVGGEAWPGWNEFEEVVLFCHGWRF